MTDETRQEAPQPEQVPVLEGHQLVGLVVRSETLQLDAGMVIALDGDEKGTPVAVVHNGDGTWTALVVPPGHRWELRPAEPVKTLWLPKGQA